MIWRDKVGDILTGINAQAVYNTARSTTPSDLELSVYNQAQDHLAMIRPWRDLKVVAEIVLDSDRKITMPDDYGCAMYVYTDASHIGKPSYFYYLDHDDVAMRYVEEVTFDETTNKRTIKFAFPNNVFLPSNPFVVYSKTLPNITSQDRQKYSFFPKNLMLAFAKKILQDYYGVAANQDPNWINNRTAEELKLFESYAYQNNTPLDLTIKDRFGNPVFIQGSSLNGQKPMLGRPSPYLPSTLFSGGT